MKTARDYGPYAKLMRHAAIRRLIAVLNAASREAKVTYMVLGGSAVYLHTRRNPVDYPDLDLIVDGTKAQAKRLVSALGRRVRLKADKWAETETDVFFKLSYRGFDIDLFTSQEERPTLGLPVMIGKVPVRRIEGLIAEKLQRFSYPDILMLFDLLRKKYDRAMVMRFAHENNAASRLVTLQRIVAARASVASMRRWAAIMAGGERRGHIV